MRVLRFGLGQAGLAVAGIVGIMLLVPGDGSPARATTASVSSALSTSPELARYLGDSVAATPGGMTSAEVLEMAAAKPEPKAPVEPVSVPTLEVAALAEVDPEPMGILRARQAVNLRSGPSTDYSTLSVLDKNEEVALLGQEGGWSQIRRADGSTGWVYGDYLGDGPAPAPAEPEIQQVAAVSNAPADDGLTSISLRAAPRSGSATVASVAPGTPLRVAERRDGWMLLVLPSGESGWVRGL